MRLESKIGGSPDCSKCENGGGFCLVARFNHDGNLETPGLTGDCNTCGGFEPTLTTSLRDKAIDARMLLYSIGSRVPLV